MNMYDLERIGEQITNSLQEGMEYEWHKLLTCRKKTF